MSVRERPELFVRRGIVLSRIVSLPPATTVVANLRKAARPMIVQVRVEVRCIEALNGVGVLAGNMPVTQMFAHHSSILPLYQSIIRTAVGTRAGERHSVFFQQLVQRMIDEFRTVIGMQFQDAKRELVEYGLQHGQEMFLIDAPDAADHFPLCYFINGIEMIHSLDTVPVSLMYRIDAHEPRRSLRIGPTSFADGNPRWLGQGKLCSLLPVSHTVPESGEMRRRDLRQVGILALTEHVPLPFNNSARRRSTELLMGPIHSD